MNEPIVIRRLQLLDLYRVECGGAGLVVPHWRITEQLIHRVTRMYREIFGVGI